MNLLTGSTSYRRCRCRLYYPALPLASDTLPGAGMKKGLEVAHRCKPPTRYLLTSRREAPREKKQGEPAERRGEAGAKRGSWRGWGLPPSPPPTALTEAEERGHGRPLAAAARLAASGRCRCGAAPSAPAARTAPRPAGGRRAQRPAAQGGRAAAPSPFPCQHGVCLCPPRSLRGSGRSSSPPSAPTPPPRASSAAVVTPFAHISLFAIITKLDCV